MKKLFLFLLLLPIFAFAQETTTAFPDPIGLVSDFEDIFTPEQEEKLMAILKPFAETDKGVIVVATINNIGNYTDFDQYTFDLSNHWGVGDAEKDNGLTIIMSSNLRKIRINTGNGTSKIISDTFCENILQKNVIPHFKKTEYYEGITEAVQELINKWNKH